jgi:heme exporter protein D
MPDLGKYAGEVLLAYGVSLGLIAALVAVSIAQGRRMKRALDEAEERQRDG